MRYDLSDPLHVQQFRTRAEKLIGQRSMVELKEKKARSLSQNAYIHVCVAYIAVRLGETEEYVKQCYFKLHCNSEIFLRRAFDTRIDTKTAYLRSTASISKEEASVAIDRFRDWAARELGEYIPSADEHAHLARMQTEIERAAQYL